MLIIIDLKIIVKKVLKKITKKTIPSKTSAAVPN